MARSQLIVGMEITLEEARVVALQQGGTRTSVLGAESFPWNGSEPRQIAREVKEYLRQFGGKAMVRCCTSMPTNFVRLIELPAVDEATLEHMVRYELERQIAIPIEEVITDHCVLGTGVNGMAHVLVGGVRRDTFESVRQLIESVASRQCTCTLTALAEAGFAFRKPEVDSAATAVAVVDVRASQAMITVYDGADEFFTRTTGPVAAERLVTEIRRTLSGYHAAFNGSRIGKCLLAGEGAAGVAEDMKTMTNPSVELSDPWAHFQSPPTTPPEPHRFFAATAAAVGSGDTGLRINLLREGRTASLTSQRRSGWLMAIALFVLIALAGGVWSFKNRMALGKSELARIESQVHRLQRSLPTADAKPAASPDTQTIEGLAREARRSSFTWLEVLRTLSADLPAKVWLTELNCEEDREVVVNGSASSADDIAKTVSVLEKAGQFSDVRLVYSRRAESEDRKGFDFQVSCSLQTGRRKEPR